MGSLEKLAAPNLASSSTDKDLSSELTGLDPSNLADKQTDNESTHGLLGQMPQQLRQVVENLGQRAKTEELSLYFFNMYCAILRAVGAPFLLAAAKQSKNKGLLREL